MGWPVVTVASGGLPVTDVSATTKIGLPVSEATNGYGIAVTNVANGMPVVYVAPPLMREVNGQTDRDRAGQVARRQTGS